MQARGELAVPCECPECHHKFTHNLDLTGFPAGTKAYDAQQFVGTEAKNLTDVRNLRKPWQPRPRWPAWLVQGVLAGSGTAAVLMAAGVEKPLAVPFVTIPFVCVLFNRIEQRAHRPRTRKERTTVRVNVEGERDTAKENLNFDCSIKALRTFASQVDAVANTSETAWTGSGKPFSRPEYYTLRDELIKAGFGRWKNERHHAQGWNLTAKGKALMRGLAPTPRS